MRHKRKQFQGFRRPDDVWFKVGSGDRLLFRGVCPYNNKAITEKIELMKKNLLGEPDIQRRFKEVFTFDDKKAGEDSKIFKKNLFGDAK